MTGAKGGSIKGVKTIEAGDTMKLKTTRILNVGGLYERMIKNRASGIGLLCTSIESGIVAVKDVGDVFNSVVAGTRTGALFKAVSEVRYVALAGVIGGSRLFLHACDLDFEPLYLSLSSFASCVLEFLTNRIILWHYLEAS
ncbi:hypothetical protein Tco_1000903 [Tanacetum coccineum]